MSRLRIRSIKPDCWVDEAISPLSRDARLLFVVLITFADDDGRFRYMPAQIIGHGYIEDDDVTPADVGRWVAELEEVGVLVRYEVKGKRYATFPNWHKHQRINRHTDSELPPCPRRAGVVIVPRKQGEKPPTDSRSDHGALTEDSVNTHDKRDATSLQDMECGVGSRERGEETPLTPRGGNDDPAPPRPSGNRDRDVAAYQAAMSDWAAQHFPDAQSVDAVIGAVGWMSPRCDGRVTAQALRDLAASSDTWAEPLGLSPKEPKESKEAAA